MATGTAMRVTGITNYRKIEDYRQSILHVGGDVRILEPSMSVVEALDDLGSLLLAGGEDVAPERYGEKPRPSVVNINAERDTFELALVVEARRRGLPILGICRGIQVLNVACGGTLVQDIPSQVAGALEHNLTVPPHQPFALAHEIWLDRDTLLARLMGEPLGAGDTCEVNSRHHQAVKELAPGFLASATAPDGVIEAIEDPSARFCLGVQWHPENFWRTGEFRPLFEAFLEAGRQVTP
jgi:putative glutamine amidotransferase